jgi:hypothetical protein
MEQLWTWIRYLRDHPSAAVCVVLAAAAVYWLANRKPKLQREADKRLEEIRSERGDPYNKPRPLR